MNLLNNRYRIIKELGAGGFGNTYLAEDTQMPSLRCCVIKQLKPATHNPQVHQLVQQRFAREAAVLEKLGEHSTQIPKLFAYFTEGGQFYLVQEWIEGTTLTQKVQDGVLNESAVKEILVSLLSVLQFVHTQGIVHRDIKPDNIILRSRDGKPVLIDFGAVRETIGTQINSQGQPTGSIVIGTPGFMPSEQAAGRPVYSSDLYSLGLTAIYLLTGKMPQQLVTDPVSGEIIWDKQGISANLANVLDKAVRSHPRERFASAKEMLDALESAPVSYPTQPPGIPPTPPRMPQGGTPLASSTPTVRIAPQGASPPAIVNTDNKLKPVAIGSLVAAGLIGGSVALGLMLNRKPTARETPSPEPIASVTPTPAPIRESEPPVVNSEPSIDSDTEETPTDQPVVEQSPQAITPSREPEPPVVNSPLANSNSERSPQPTSSPIASSSPSLSPTAPVVTSTTALSQVFPTAPNVLSKTPKFARCLDGEVIYMVGEMANARFAICGLDENPPQTPTAYLAYDRRTGELNRAEFTDNRYSKFDYKNKRLYAYDPPSYSQSTYSNPVVGVYRDGRLIQNVKIIKLYKKER